MIQPSPEILFRRPALVTGRMMLRLAWVLVLFGVRWYAPPASPLGLFGVRWFEPPANAIPYYLHAEIFILELALIVAGMVGWQFWLRRAGGPKPIRLGQEVITLPRGPDSLRTVMIAYSDVRSVTVMGHGWRKRLILDTTRGAFVYPVSRFMAPDAAEALRAGLRLRIEALADGAERWAAMEARHRLAESLSAASPWGTWSAAAVLVACFVAQRAIDGAELGFAGIDSGANSSFLVRNGEWFRLFSGNLLHASPQHLIGNCAMLLLLGIMLERLLGVANFLIVLLATAVMSLGVSALAGLAYGSNISSLGASGAIFGLLGALCVVTLRYRRDLPGGYRLSLRVWIVLIGLNMVILPVFSAHVDQAAHLGGFAAGLLTGLLLVRGWPSLQVAARSSQGSRLALAGLSVAWVAAIGATCLHISQPDLRRADHYEIAHAMLAAGRFPPLVENLVAWTIATDAQAPRPALGDARLLARRGVEQLQLARQKLTGAKARLADTQIVAVTDTEASLAYRLGYGAAAAALEAGIDDRSPATLRHMALFLDTARRGGAAAVADPAIDMPRVTLEHGTVRLTVAKAGTDDGEIYALLHRGRTLLGVMLLRVPAGFDGEQILPLPVRRGAPSAEPPEAFWTDPATSVDVARYDPDGCRCSDPIIGPDYTAYDAKLAALP